MFWRRSKLSRPSSGICFTYYNTENYSANSLSWYESISKGNNFFQLAYLCSNLSFCHKTGSCFQNIEKIFLQFTLPNLLRNSRGKEPARGTVSDRNRAIKTVRRRDKWPVTGSTVVTISIAREFSAFGLLFNVL